jgi:uncharacterized membrane protein
MTTIEKSIDVDVPVSTAYNQWTQFEEFPEFMSGVDQVTQVDDQTRVTLQLDWEPEGFVETAGAALQIDDMQVARDLAKFKEIIEAQGTESGAWRGDIDRAPDATGR